MVLMRHMLIVRRPRRMRGMAVRMVAPTGGVSQV